MSETFVHFF